LLLEIAGEERKKPSREILEEQIDVATDLIAIGSLLERPEVTDEAQQIAGNLLLRARLEGVGDIRSAIRDADRVALALAKADRQAAAEALLIESLVRAAREAAKQSPDSRNYRTFDATRERLVNLAAFYHETGRHEDVRILLEQAQGWGAGDLSAILEEKSPFSPDPMGILAARAFRQAERNDDARRVVNAYLDLDGGTDSAYELLLELGGPDVGKRLDELYARDRFEERPLIWKAQVLIDEQNLAQAEETVRAAIAIDPSDGEQGKGDRMRAYAVLGDILMLQADEAQAQQMASAVRAIRMSENADDFNAAGLHTQAIAMYREALEQFADAYCIQSRLAIQLAEQGRMEEAEKHYLRAYALMPDSFGRIESHCFGCEGAFRGDAAQSIAEKVFADLIAQNPNKPQLHYLLGYLRAAQGRREEALESYLRAVELDPDYVNAWAKIQALSRILPIPAAVRDDATVNLVRLDPLGRHTRPDLDQMSDLARMWKTLADYQVAIPPTPPTLYPLAASMRPGIAVAGKANSPDRPLTPGGALVRHQVLKAWLQMLQQVARGNR
jgi:tetratricopeptide (TPR) repeat protein